MSLQPRSATSTDILERADQLERHGRRLEAIDALEAAHHVAPHGAIERRLVELRLAAFEELRDGPPPAPWPDPAELHAPLQDGLPVVPADELTAAVARSAIVRHGCVRVPDLVPAERCAELVADIDRAFAACEEPAQETGDAWYRPFAPALPAPPGPPLDIQRQRAARGGSLWSADSPRLLQAVCDLIEQAGLRQVIREYLGQRPVMSATKSNLRRVPLDAVYADWHQDGAFLGTGIRTINVWITLTDCGVDAPSMDIVPLRLDHIVETGTEGAIFDWAVAPAKAAEVAGDVGVVRPAFRAGEALLFDELLLHRTACEQGMTQRRYALEHWYFGATDYPGRQIPLVF